MVDAVGDDTQEPDEIGPRARWNTRHAERVREATDPTSPARFVTDQDHLLPDSGRALDVAGGSGRHALWLAARGLATTLADVSDTACAEATARAVAAGVSLDVVRADLTVEPMPPGPWHVIVVHHFLDRDLWRRLPDHLAPGGILLACQPTVTNLERHARPGRRWLLEDGEVATMATALTDQRTDLEVLEASEGWTEEGRHEAHLVLRRSG